MTVLLVPPKPKFPWLGALRQTVLILLINVPTASFGMSLAWVSLASGARAVESKGAVTGGAAATHVAAIAGVLLAAAALKMGRKPPLVAASACFAICWGLKLQGGAWCILVARTAAGLAGAAAWAAAPLLGREICSSEVGGAAAAAPVLAHNLGFLLMYAAADADLPHSVILWCCLSVSLVHCVAFMLVPESPSFLAASGRLKEAKASLAWLRGLPSDRPELTKELEALPPKEDDGAGGSPLTLLKELYSDRQRRRALVVSVIAVAGQESCGLLALLQFAEQVFGEVAGDPSAPARHALVLGGVQLVASGAALYLVERIGRRPLTVWTALVCCVCLSAGAGISWAGGRSPWLAAALGGAVAADSLGMQPAPYALLADMFEYRYRGCALLVATAVGAAGNALEVVLFGAAAAAGMHAALGLAAALTGAFALFAIIALPETRNKDPQEIYDVICPNKRPHVEECGGGDAGNKYVGKPKAIAVPETRDKDPQGIYDVICPNKPSDVEERAGGDAGNVVDRAIAVRNVKDLSIRTKESQKRRAFENAINAVNLNGSIKTVSEAQITNHTQVEEDENSDKICNIIARNGAIKTKHTQIVPELHKTPTQNTAEICVTCDDKKGNSKNKVKFLNYDNNLEESSRNTKDINKSSACDVSSENSDKNISKTEWTQL